MSTPTIIIPAGCPTPLACVCGVVFSEKARTKIRAALDAGKQPKHEPCGATFSASLAAPVPEEPAFSTPPPPKRPRSPVRDKTDRAIARAEEHADPEWLAEAGRALARVAARQETLTMDDVWNELEASGVGGPREPRASGAVIVGAVRAGTIARVKGVTAESKRETRNSGFLSVWRSLVYRAPVAAAVATAPTP